jgi:hypothetical protein
MQQKIKPFDLVCQVLASLMEERGFRVGRGTYANTNGETLPTWVINRPDTPAWQGVWATWEYAPDDIKENEQHTLFRLCLQAITEWENVAWMYTDETENKETPGF